MLSTWNIQSCIIKLQHAMNVLKVCGEMRATRCVSSSITLFSALEIEGVLDPINEVDSFCLYYIF